MQNVLVGDSLPPMKQLEAWLSLLHSSYDTRIAAILCLAPNLRSLSLSMESHGPSYWRGFGFDFNALQTVNLVELSITSLLAGCDVFQKLRHVWIDGKLPIEDDSPGGWNIRLISAFMRLPAIKTFRGSDFRDMKTERRDDADMEAWLCEFGTSNVTVVELTDCDIGAQSMCNILRSAQALEKFDCWRVCEGCQEDMELNDYSYTNVHEALYRHRKTLRSLILNTRTCGGSILPFRPLETLAALHRLHYLELDEDALVGDDHLRSRSLAEILPDNLDKMTILSAWASHASSAFLQFLARGLMEAKALQSIKVLQGHLRNADEVVKEFPDIEIKFEDEKIPPPPRNVFMCDFILSKRDLSWERATLKHD